MRTLRRASYGYLLRHPIQLLLALTGIAVGVAVIVAVDLANSSASKAFRLSMDAVTGAATHQLVSGPAGVAAELYTRLRVLEGQQRLAPVIEGYVEQDDSTLRVLGVDPFAEREFREYAWPDGDGSRGQEALATLLTTPGAVLLTAGTAAALGVEAGDTFTVSANGIPRQALVAGYLDHGGREVELQNLLVSDIATAQHWFGMQGRLTRIDVRRISDTALEQLREALPDGVQLLSAPARTAAIAEMSTAFRVNLTAMSLLALLVGIFLVYNSVSFAVLQRRGLLAGLRALGVTRSEVLRLIFVEALTLGIAGSVLGLFAGIWLGELLLQLVSQSINDLYFRVTVTTVSVDPATVAKGIGAGVLATLLAALLPAIEAALQAPRLGLQRATLEQRTGRLLPLLLVPGIVLVAAVQPVLTLSEKSLVAGLIALFMLILGIAICIPFFVRLLLRMLAFLAGFVGGDLTRLTIAGIGANMSRTGVAIVALSIAVSATVGVSIMVDSFRQSVSDWLDQTLQADLYVTPVQGSFDPELQRAIADLPGVAEASNSRRVWLESPGGRTRLIALQMASGSYAGIDLLEVSGEDLWTAFEEDGNVLVSESYSFRFDVKPGGAVRLPTDRGERAFRVGAIYRSFDSQPEAVIMSRTIYDLFWDDRAVDGVGLYLEATADAESVVDAVRALTRNRQSLDVRSNAELRSLSLTIFDRTFLITNVLYWLAVGVAVVGILAATLALQMERSRELATLRALGVTRLQLGGMVTLQSALMGLVSGLFALPLGILMARVLIDVINRRAFGWSMPISVNPAELTQAVLLAATVALLAGLYPAWRAGQSQPALAMRED